MVLLQFVRKYFGKITTIVVVGLLLIAVNHTFIHWRLPIGKSTHSEVAPSGPAKIIKITPEVLDCRARIVASVPIKGERKHQSNIIGWHFNYQTDTVKMTAIGDIDTCVKGGADPQQLKDGSWIVTVSGKSIIFNRPRVDASATAQSVTFQKGWVGKLTDVFPWVSETNHLVPAGYAYAQSVIGGSSCMEAAWLPTQKAIIAAYTQQAVAKHIDPKKVKVLFTDVPNFTQNDGNLKATKLKGFTFKADAAHVVCNVQLSALQAS